MKFALISTSLCAIALFLSLSTSSAHPTYYDIPAGSANCTDLEKVPFYSYHIHVLFWQKNNESVYQALWLREQFVEKFQPGAPCTGLFHQDRLCMFDVAYDADGPFTTGQWAAFVPLEDFARTVPWIMQHRGFLDILVHPNSGCELSDHLEWPVWGGTKWELDPSMLHHQQPYPWPSDSPKAPRKQQRVVSN